MSIRGFLGTTFVHAGWYNTIGREKLPVYFLMPDGGGYVYGYDEPWSDWVAITGDFSVLYDAKITNVSESIERREGRLVLSHGFHTNKGAIVFEWSSPEGWNGDFRIKIPYVSSSQMPDQIKQKYTEYKATKIVDPR